MSDFGPVGGDGGSPFEDVAPAGARIAGLIIRSGGPRNVVVAIQVYYVSPTGQVTFGDRHGGGAGDEENISLQAGEFFTQISGRYGQFLDSLTVETSGGPNGPRRFGRFGGLGGSEDYEFPEVNGQEIIGFFGRAGTLVDALGVRT
jgi:Jacalin-like lectin domain